MVADEGSIRICMVYLINIFKLVWYEFIEMFKESVTHLSDFSPSWNDSLIRIYLKSDLRLLDWLWCFCRFVYGLHPFESVFIKTVWGEASTKEAGNDLGQVKQIQIFEINSVFAIWQHWAKAGVSGWWVSCSTSILGWGGTLHWFHFQDKRFRSGQRNAHGFVVGLCLCKQDISNISINKSLSLGCLLTA